MRSFEHAATRNVMPLIKGYRRLENGIDILPLSSAAQLAEGPAAAVCQSNTGWLRRL